MKRLIVALLAIVLMAAPVAADEWTFTFSEMDPTVENIQFYYGPNDNTAATADEFLQREDLTSTDMIPVSGPMTFTVDFADDVEYAVYARVFDALGNNDYIKDAGSPTIWWTNSDSQQPAKYIHVEGQKFSESEPKIIINYYEAQ